MNISDSTSWFNVLSCIYSSRPRADQHRKIAVRMKKTSFTQPGGEEISLYQDADGNWCCPVCGSAELQEQPYYAEGGASFDMCSVCGFEFGFDDEPLASGTEISGIQNNWIHRREKLLKCASLNKCR